MASEQRIIGGALFVLGIVVLVILLKYLPDEGGISPEKAQQDVTQTFWPGYVKAEATTDYAAMSKFAGEIEETISEGGRVPVLKHLNAEAATNKSIRRLVDLIESGTFVKNAEGLFGYKDQWFAVATHRAAVALDDAVNTRLKALRYIRATAVTARKAIEEARSGSKLPIELPAAPAAPESKAPVMDPNPVLDFDRELYCVFGLPAEELSKALTTKNPGGAARPARIRWNRDVAPGPLSDDVVSIPERAGTLVTLANDIERNALSLADDPAAADTLAKLLERGATLLADGVTGPPKELYVANRALFAKAEAIGAILRLEAQMLDSYLVPVRVLAKQFKVEFGLD
jgi:hypothetical protein